jgi:hypothetical protein
MNDPILDAIEQLGRACESQRRTAEKLFMGYKLMAAKLSELYQVRASQIAPQPQPQQPTETTADGKA